MKKKERLKRKQQKIPEDMDKHNLKDQKKPKRVSRERKNIAKMHREKG